METRVLYGIARIVWDSMIWYGFVWRCMDVYDVWNTMGLYGLL